MYTNFKPSIKMPWVLSPSASILRNIINCWYFNNEAEPPLWGVLYYSGDAKYTISSEPPISFACLRRPWVFARTGFHRPLYILLSPADIYKISSEVALLSNFELRPSSPASIWLANEYDDSGGGSDVFINHQSGKISIGAKQEIISQPHCIAIV